MPTYLTVQEVINQRVEKFYKDLEFVCAKAISNGNNGVRVVWGSGLAYTITEDATVPYGQIWETHA